MSGPDPTPAPDADGWIVPGAPGASDRSSPVFRWVVTEDMIDLDRMGEVLVRATRRARDPLYTPTMVGILLVVVIGITAVTGGVGPGLVLLLVVAGFWVWSVGPGRHSMNRMGLQREPLVLGPYVLRADASGLYLSSPKGGTSSPWSSCRSVATDDGHLVLGLRTDEHETIRIVPWAGLDPGSGPPEGVLATIQGWIAAASGDAPGRS